MTHGKNKNVLQLPPTQPTHTDIFLRKPRSAQDRDGKSGVINHFYFLKKENKQTLKIQLHLYMAAICTGYKRNILLLLMIQQ